MGEVAIIKFEVVLEGHSLGRRIDVVNPGNVYLPILGDVEHGAGTAADGSRL